MLICKPRSLLLGLGEHGIQWHSDILLYQNSWTETIIHLSPGVLYIPSYSSDWILSHGTSFVKKRKIPTPQLVAEHAPSSRLKGPLKTTSRHLHTSSASGVANKTPVSVSGLWHFASPPNILLSWPSKWHLVYLTQVWMSSDRLFGVTPNGIWTYLGCLDINAGRHKVMWRPMDCRTLHRVKHPVKTSYENLDMVAL